MSLSSNARQLSCAETTRPNGTERRRGGQLQQDEASASPSVAQLLHSGEACTVYRPLLKRASAASSAFFFAIAASWSARASAAGRLGGEGGRGGIGGGDGDDGGFGNGGGFGGSGGEGEAEGGGVEGGDCLVQRAQPAP